MSSTPAPNTREWALRYIVDRSWYVVPVPYRQKSPILDAWQTFRFDVEDVPVHFNGKPANIGVILGPSKLADVDLDCPEAIYLASYFIPTTACIFGRHGAPASHRLYMAQDGAEFQHTTFKDSSGAMLVELRTGPNQTIFPPSVHKDSGESIEWVKFGDPPTVAPSDLLRSVSKLAAATLLARSWPAEGGRHEASLALAGGLLRAGWPTNEVTDFIRGVAEAGGDDEVSDRVKGVGYTADKLIKGEKTTGWPTLAKVLSEQIVEKVLDWLGIETVEADAQVSEQQTPRKSQATLLVDIATGGGYELFHTPEGDAYATVDVGGHQETHSMRAKAFKRLLAQQFYSQTSTAAGSQALQDALTVLEGKAIFEGEECPVYIRIAEHEGYTYIDLANERWESVKITPRGWGVVSVSPVKFRRAGGMLSLPTPLPGGRLSELRRFINVRSDSDWLLLQAFIVAALRPRGPYPTLAAVAEQGSGKSVLMRIIRSLVDPNSTPLRSEPRSTHDLMIAARNAWVLAFDNLSHIKSDLSDAFCRLSTGGGFATRELYSDDSEVLFDAQRPVMINGIEELTTRADLLDRALIFSLPSIPDRKRMPESLLWASFEVARPRIFGALLDAVSCAMRRLPSVQLSSLPRMADFAMWAVAAEPALDLTRTDDTDDTDDKSHTFIQAYTGNREEANSLALEGSLVAQKLLELMSKRGGNPWQGTASQLLAELSALVEEREQRDKAWPKRANSLSGQLNRIAPNLRKLGVDMQWSRSGPKGTRQLTITDTKEAVKDRQYRQTVSDTHTEARITDDPPATTDDPPSSTDDGSSVDPPWDVLESGGTDDTDDTDDPLQPYSNMPGKEGNSADYDETAEDWTSMTANNTLFKR